MDERYSKLDILFDKREQELRQQAARTRGGNTVFPDDWESTREKRIKRAGNDFEFYCQTYFESLFVYESCDEQIQMTDCAVEGGRWLDMFGADREFGKTVRFFAFKTWCGCYGKKSSYGKVSDTIDLVRKDYRRIRIELDLNQRIISDFGHILDDEWNSQDSFHIKPHDHNPNGTFFYAFSTTVTARGYRLDFLEFDDFEDFSTSINPDVSIQKLEIIERDFLPALLEHGSAVYLGNNARTTCVINILRQMSDTDRTALHPAIRIHIVPAWDREKQRPTWHQRFAFTSEDEMRLSRLVSLSVWLAESMQEPRPPEGSRFMLKDWIAYDRIPRDAKGIMFCDPAFGESSDDKGIGILLYSSAKRKFYAPDAFTDQCGWGDYFKAQYDMYIKWERYLMYIGWEEDFGQAQYLEFRKVHDEVKDLPELPIREISVKPWGDKPTRIEKLEYPFSRGEILFAPDFLKTPHGIRAQEQMIGYNGKKTAKRKLGYIDALASCYLELWHLSLEDSKELSSSPARMSGRRRYAVRH